VCTGTATACSIGTDERLAYTYIGDAVNLAKRLQDLAGPGEILVSETTVNELEDSTDSITGLFGLYPLPPLSIKGRQDDVIVYRAEVEAAGSNGK
jgi:adenylate cyclase